MHNQLHQRAPRWDYTQEFKLVHGDSYKGRPLIGRDTRIDGGVYAGLYSGEALVVDRQRYPEAYHRLQNDVEARISDLKEQGYNLPRNRLIPTAIFKTIRDTMRYSPAEVSILYWSNHSKDGEKVELGNYIHAGVGVCRHQALAVASLLEMYTDSGELPGKVGVDRSKDWNPNGELDEHAWVRYTNSANQVYILDVAQDYFGPLTNRRIEHGGWNYLRPEEQQSRHAAHSAGAAVMHAQTVELPRLTADRPGRHRAV
jgi:hypothetical protein